MYEFVIGEKRGREKRENVSAKKAKRKYVKRDWQEGKNNK